MVTELSTLSWAVRGRKLSCGSRSDRTETERAAALGSESRGEGSRAPRLSRAFAGPGVVLRMAP